MIFSKEMTAFGDTTCDNCGSPIWSGDPFYFKRTPYNPGNDEKWCENCVDKAESK